MLTSKGKWCNGTFTLKCGWISAGYCCSAVCVASRSAAAVCLSVCVCVCRRRRWQTELSWMERNSAKSTCIYRITALKLILFEISLKISWHMCVLWLIASVVIYEMYGDNACWATWWTRPTPIHREDNALSRAPSRISPSFMSCKYAKDPGACT